MCCSPFLTPSENLYPLTHPIGHIYKKNHFRCSATYPPDQSIPDQ